MKKQSRREEVIELYRKGFGQVAISEVLGIHQSTVSRYINNPSKDEVEDFYENHAYGAYTTQDDERILFNRRYKSLEDKRRVVEKIMKVEWFYNDGTFWAERFFNSLNEIVIHKDEVKKK